MSYKYIIIGGSAGSFQSVTTILSALPMNFPLPVFLCLHRLKHVRTGFVEALSIKSNMKVIEPLDKEYIRQYKAYLAPANYHMYFELGNYIALSTEPPVNHSRPSIDISFASAAYTYKSKLIGIILSGANKDGAYGLSQVKENGGLTIVQDPEECQVKTMTAAAIAGTKVDHILNLEDIIRFLLKFR
jgi:two-component system, chemotaxis family, protein-glutamate methylesterase/glutaminase